MGKEKRGFTLIELLVILVLTSVVMGGLTSVLVRQQRFYRGTAELIETRSQIRQAAGIIPADLRGVSTVGGDIITMTSSRLVFRANIGSAVACLVAGTTLVVPPMALTNGNTLVHFTQTPQIGDVVFVYNDGLTQAAADDEWEQYTLAAAPSTSTVPCSDLTGAADLNTPRSQFTLTGAAEPTIVVGAPIRFTRQTEYSLYQEADGSWYLGYCSPTCAPSTPMQPLAGPFLAGGGANAGVSFSYVDENGAATAVPANVAQVSIVVRGQTAGAVDMGGYKNTTVGDSLRFSIAIRNRR